MKIYYIGAILAALFLVGCAQQNDPIFNNEDRDVIPDNEDLYNNDTDAGDANDTNIEDIDIEESSDTDTPGNQTDTNETDVTDNVGENDTARQPGPLHEEQYPNPTGTGGAQPPDDSGEDNE